MRTRRLVLVLILGFSTRAMAQDVSDRQRPTRAENRAIEKILSLEREIEALMAALPPHLRDVVRERLEVVAAARADAVRVDAEAAEARAAAERAAVAASVEAERPESIASPPSATSSAVDPVATAPPRLTESPQLTKPKATSCTTLWTFDTDRNGRIDGFDRYWRHFYLWSDTDGDGAVGDDEVQSAYERGVQEVAVALDLFIRRKKETAGEIEIGKYIVLDVAGDGFDGHAVRTADDAALVVDASRLARGEGPVLLAGDDTPLEGLQPFRSGLRLRVTSDETVALSCP